MFSGGGFCESPFMGLSTITVNGERFLFDFVVDQSLPLIFSVTRQYHATGMSINQSSTFNFIIDPTGSFDFIIDKQHNSDFLR
jgi:hypothetical protein